MRLKEHHQKNKFSNYTGFRVKRDKESENFKKRFQKTFQI